MPHIQLGGFGSIDCGLGIARIFIHFVEAPETGLGKVQRHRSGSRSTVY